MTGPDDDDLAKYQALEAEMAQEDPDLADVPQNESYTPEAGRQQEQYSEQRHGGGEPQQHQPQYSGIPDQSEDPIGHFSARANAVEGHLQHKEFWEGITQSEGQMSSELEEGEYYEAVEALKEQRLGELYSQFPDNHQTAILAHRHGFQSPAHMRAYQLQQDAIAVAQAATANGLSPAQAYYQLAVQRGVHRPRTVMTKSFTKNVMKNLDKATPEQFDQFWEMFKRASKKVEGS